MVSRTFCHSIHFSCNFLFCFGGGSRTLQPKMCMTSLVSIQVFMIYGVVEFFDRVDVERLH